MKIIYETVIGSHMWGMNRQDSDMDIFRIYKEPLYDIIDGTAKYESRHTLSEDGKMDYTTHEIRHVINQLLKGNINFYLGVLSPMRNKDNELMELLRTLIWTNPPKNIYHSIRGMAIGNYKKYIESGEDTTEKKCNQICRILKFGCKLLDSGKFVFNPISNSKPKDIPKLITKLDKSYKKSKLSETIDEEQLRYILVKIRLS
jgi:predicted nucleotidyltransferase